MQYINFGNNSIKHVGHDLILPNTGSIFFDGNPCTDFRASTPDQIVALRFTLLVSCPPTISQIENTLESRHNLLTNVNDKVINHTIVLTNVHGQIESLVESHSGIDYEVEYLKNEVRNVTGRIEDQIQSLVGRSDSLKQRHLQMDYSVRYLMQLVTDLFERNKALEQRLESLEGIIEGQQELKIGEAINENQ